MQGAHSIEFDDNSEFPVIHLMAHQHAVTRKGGSMRLGSYPCVLKADSLARKVYGSSEIHERHRHRYEFNNAYRERLQEGGLVFAGLSPDESLVEVVELPEHPWFLGCQFHPEFKSRPYAPHPLFEQFVKAALTNRKQAA